MIALGGGYAIGRAATGDAGSAATDPREAPDTIAPAVSVPAESPADVPAPDVDVKTHASASDAADAPIEYSGGNGWSMFGNLPLQLLAERTLPDGTIVRAQLAQMWDNVEDWGAGGWVPAPWCYESGQMRIAVAGNGMIDVGTVPWYREPYQARAVSWLLLGGADNAPITVVVVQTPADTASVTVDFADGSTDRTVPQGGYALLVGPGPAVPADAAMGWVETAPSFEVRLDGGTSPGTFSSAGTDRWNDPAFRQACEPPPPALPEPGEQPVDAAAARDRIVMMMTALYDQSVAGERDLYVDDVTGVAEARQQVADGSFGEQAMSAQAVIEELVFTSPTEAWFRYRIDTDAGSYANRYGMAVVVDGDWRITRDTICQDLAFAGGDCGSNWHSIQPPSVYEATGASPMLDFAIDGEMSAD